MRYIAFLRGINVSGQKLIKMEALREYCALPGFDNIVTYIQSGNVLFDARKTGNAVLAGKLEKQLLQCTGFDIPVVVRSLEEIKKVIEKNPFTGPETGTDKMYVTFLGTQPHETTLNTLDSFAKENEMVKVCGTEVYLQVPAYGDTKLSNTLIEKKLKVAATTRNWATVNKVLGL